MSKKKIGEDFENLAGTSLPDYEGKEDLTEVGKGEETMPAPKLQRRKTPKKDKYTSFRMRTEILKEMEEIAEKERVPFTGQLVHAVLKNYIDWYKKTKK